MYFIIADDLTGATDTGIQFQKRGIATTVLVEPPRETPACLGERTALSINASSRELCPQEARDRTQEVLRRMILWRSWRLRWRLPAAGSRWQRPAFRGWGVP